jgi:pimeloyl-ACP methyl ester carboxylesterase
MAMSQANGGAIAQVLAADHSDRVASLVNLGAAGRAIAQAIHVLQASAVRAGGF